MHLLCQKLNFWGGLVRVEWGGGGGGEDGREREGRSIILHMTQACYV